MKKTILKAIWLVLLVLPLQVEGQVWNKLYGNSLAVYAIPGAPGRVMFQEWNPQRGGLLLADAGSASHYLVRLNSTGDTLWTRLNGFAGRSDIKSLSRLGNGDYLESYGTNIYGNCTRWDSNGAITFTRSIILNKFHSNIIAAEGDSGSYYVMYSFDTVKVISSTPIPFSYWDSSIRFLITEKYDASNNRIYGDTLLAGDTRYYQNGVCNYTPAGKPYYEEFEFHELLPAKDGGIICTMYRDSSQAFSRPNCALQPRTGVRKGGGFIRKMSPTLHEDWSTDLQTALNLSATSITQTRNMFTTSDSGCVVMCDVFDSTINKYRCSYLLKLNSSGRITDSLRLPVHTNGLGTGIETSDGKYLFLTYVQDLINNTYITGLTSFDKHFQFLSFTPWSFANAWIDSRMTPNNLGGAFCGFTADTGTTHATHVGSLNFDSSFNAYPASVSGRIVQDNNSDCMYNSGDRPLAYRPVSFTNTSTLNNYVSFANTAGIYTSNVPGGIYSATHATSANRLAECPATGFSVNLTTPVQLGNYNFYDTLLPNRRDMKVIAAPCRFVSGFNGVMNVYAINTGGANTTDTLRLLKPAGIQYVSANPAPQSVSGNVLEWVLNGVAPDSVVAVSITFHTPATLSYNTPLTFAAAIPDPLDVIQADNVDTLFTAVASSFDPNEKSVNRSLYISAKKDLVYKIDFQNTGNYPAKDVVVVDVIDKDLDLSTLRVLSATHGIPEISWNDGDKMIFRFKDIYLPDSVHNEPGSHGSFIYSIAVKRYAHVGDTIRNTASIIFDFNDLVQTDTTLNIISEAATGIQALIPEHRISCYPNPTTGKLTVVTAQSVVLTLYDMQGRNLALYDIAAGSAQISLPANLAPGIYMLQAKSTDGAALQTTRIVYQP